MLAEEAEAPPPYSPYEINDEKELSNVSCHTSLFAPAGSV